ncbi:hypothetical protein BU15DRAFT_62238 [Melanogaster broomeanus]|nr:hypothetical protein BU15DRAFT_62238 [Melanogaster broomeanus]
MQHLNCASISQHTQDSLRVVLALPTQQHRTAANGLIQVINSSESDHTDDEGTPKDIPRQSYDVLLQVNPLSDRPQDTSAASNNVASVKTIPCLIRLQDGTASAKTIPRPVRPQDGVDEDGFSMMSMFSLSTSLRSGTKTRHAIRVMANNEIFMTATHAAKKGNLARL